MCTTREAGAAAKAPAAGPKDPRQHFKLQAAQERAERLQSQPEELERQRAALMQEQALAQQEVRPHSRSVVRCGAMLCVWGGR